MDAPLKAEIGSTQTGRDFQSLPLSVSFGESVRLFGLYIKLYVLIEEPIVVETTLPARSAFEVIVLYTLTLAFCKCDDNTEPGKYPICKYCQEEGKVALLKRKRPVTAT